jgi:hypothetical protein
MTYFGDSAVLAGSPFTAEQNEAAAKAISEFVRSVVDQIASPRQPTGECLESIMRYQRATGRSFYHPGKM